MVLLGGGGTLLHRGILLGNQGLDLLVQGGQLGGGLANLVPLLLGVQGLLHVEGLCLVIAQILQPLFEGGLFLGGQGCLVLGLGLQALHLLVDFRTVFQPGKLIQTVLNPMDNPPLGIPQGNLEVCQSFIGEDNLALVNKAVGIQHIGKGLGKHGLAGSGLAHNGDGLVFIDIQGNAPNGGENSATDMEFHNQILDRQ